MHIGKQKNFQSLQLGVGVKTGEEAIIHSTKLSHEKILMSSSSSVISPIDFCNAFNSIKRSEMLKTFAISMPGIAVFTNFCYSQHSQLFYDKFVVSSESGIQQGDRWPFVFFSDALAHYRESSGIFARASTTFLVSRWWCLLMGSEENIIRSRTWLRPPRQGR